MNTSRFRALPWARIVPLAIGAAGGLYIGLAEAERVRAAEGSLYGSSNLVLFAVVGGLGLLGILLAAITRTRPLGRWLLLVAAGCLLGFVVGTVIGPRQDPDAAQALPRSEHAAAAYRSSPASRSMSRPSWYAPSRPRS